MVCLAGNLYLKDRPAGDCGDHSDGRSGLVQCRALLDVQFEVGGQLAGFAGGFLDPAQVSADVGQAGAQSYPVVVDRVQVLILQHPRHGPAADQPAVKTGALFIGENHHFHRVS